MNALARILRRRIERQGPITVADYMAAALGHPKYGYYMGKDPFGVRGDFITAPEISQMFGELIGLWCVICWRQMERPKVVHLVELGPGRGTLMGDALRAARAVPEFIDAIRLHLVETSPALRKRQGENLGDYAPRWHARLDRVPDGRMILIANEFFDALPVHQFERTGKGWVERLVHFDAVSGEFGFTLATEAAEPEAPLPARLFNAPSQTVPIGAIGEVSPEGRALGREIGGRLARSGGVALIVDYGHARSAPGETLQAVKGHQYHDVLADPGAADLTAHVDFEALAAAGAQAGARTYGPVSQGAFLASLGIDARTEALLESASPGQAQDIRLSLRRLVASSEMGVLFKALCLAHPGQPAPPGFETAK
ncbi:MAG: SAM-dependent methyltransferase [Alphaproteobacteria bacterium]|nr:SAM-dependent methyltransferase [Alphaproteobacteria bacterium]